MEKIKIESIFFSKPYKKNMKKLTAISMENNN